MSSLLKSPQLWLIASITLTSTAHGQVYDDLDHLQPKEKSTLETFPLRSLEQDDLAEAVIQGALDVPAAGPRGNVSEMSSFLPKERPAQEEFSDVHQYRTPTSINILPTPIPVGTRTYSHDYR